MMGNPRTFAPQRRQVQRAKPPFGLSHAPAVAGGQIVEEMSGNEDEDEEDVDYSEDGARGRRIQR